MGELNFDRIFDISMVSTMVVRAPKLCPMHPESEIGSFRCDFGGG